MSEPNQILERLLRENDLGWMIDLYAPSEEALPFLLKQLENVSTAFRERFKYDVSFTPEALLAESERNPHKIRAFLQALGTSGNIEMLLMAWRILQGLSIRELAMRYREKEWFELSVTLARPGQDADELEVYSTSNIKDAALVRRFGITTVDGQPLFDGFFAMHQRRS